MLVNYLPSRKVLRPKAFKPSQDGRSRVLKLSSVLSSASVIDSRQVSGRDKIRYVLEAPVVARDPGHDLRIDDGLPAIGTVSASSVLSFLKEANPRRSGNTEVDGMFDFDFRSVEYVLGATSAMVAAGIKPRLKDGNRATVHLLAPSHVMSVGVSPIVSTFMWQNGDELMTLLHLFKVAGVGEVTVPGEVTAKLGKVLTGEALGSYCLKLHANIIAMAQGCVCSADHYEAFCAGLSQVIRVHAHSDEGGAIRVPFYTRSYPRPCGAITYVASETMGLSTTRLLEPQEVTKYVVGEVLEAAGRVSRADPSKIEGTGVVFSKGVGELKPSDLNGFEATYYEMTKKWRDLVVDERHLLSSENGDTYTSERYFKADAEDTHFKGEAVSPFFWVEPMAVSVVKDGNAKMPCCQGSGGVLPMIDGVKVYKTHSYQEFGGRVPDGCKIVLLCPNGYSARASGINYLYSSRMNEEDGLDQFEVATVDRLRVVSKDHAMCDNSVSTLGQRRWITPHNPAPHVSECFTPSRTAFKYTYLGTMKEPCAEQFETLKVDVMVGCLRVDDTDPRYTTSQHHTMPVHLVKKLAETCVNRRIRFGDLEDELVGDVEATLDEIPDAAPPVEAEEVEEVNTAARQVIDVDRGNEPRTTSELEHEVELSSPGGAQVKAQVEVTETKDSTVRTNENKAHGAESSDGT